MKKYLPIVITSLLLCFTHAYAEEPQATIESIGETIEATESVSEFVLEKEDLDVFASMLLFVADEINAKFNTGFTPISLIYRVQEETLDELEDDFLFYLTDLYAQIEAYLLTDPVIPPKEKALDAAISCLQFAADNTNKTQFTSYTPLTFLQMIRKEIVSELKEDECELGEDEYEIVESVFSQVENHILDKMESGELQFHVGTDIEFEEEELLKILEPVFRIDQEGGLDNAVIMLQAMADDMNARLGTDYTALTLVQRMKIEIGNEDLPEDAYQFMFGFYTRIENYILENAN